MTSPVDAIDLVVLDAQVLALDGRGTVGTAFAARDGRILALGADHEIEALVGSSTRVLRARGLTILPGFVESHSHPMLYGVQRRSLDLAAPTVRDVSDIVALVRERARVTQKGRWIEGWGYDQTKLAERRPPTRWELDAASADHPVCLWHVSGHIIAVNSLALQLAGIDRDTPDEFDGMHGLIVRDPGTGQPTGELRERGARNRVTKVMPKLGADELLEAVSSVLEEYASRGITTIHDAGVGFLAKAADVVAYQRAAEQGRLKTRVVMMLREELLPGVAAGQGDDLGFRTGFGNDWLKFGAVKLTQDGSIQGLSGALTRGYACDPENFGVEMYDPAELSARVTRLHTAGFQMAIHGNGDRAIDSILAAYESALAAAPRPDHRHRIEHCQMVRDDQLDRMAALGVKASFFIKHVYYWGDRHRDIFIGPERAERISPLRSASAREIRWGLHSDTPVTPIDPLFGVWCAVNRITDSGQLLGAGERVSPTKALFGYGLDAAYLAFDERRMGSIEPGKHADFVVLDRNPLDVPPMELRDIRVLLTFASGRETYRSDGAPDLA